MADCSARVREVLKSVWEVEAMSPGVADHITPGIAAGRPFREAAMAGRVGAG